MTLNEFSHWLDGFCLSYTGPLTNIKLFEALKQKINEVNCNDAVLTISAIPRENESGDVDPFQHLRPSKPLNKS